MYHGATIGVAIPALNEAQSIGVVVARLRRTPVDRIVVCNNASTDDTAAVAIAAGAVVVDEPRKGYGAACQRAIAALTDCDCIVFMDGDNAMNPDELTALLDAWRGGADLVIGSRALGVAERGSMTALQRAGNWFAGQVLTRAFHTRVTDLGPFRAIAPATLAALGVREPTFGWTVEMQANALEAGLRVVEVPVSNALRIGESKVSGTWRGRIGASIGILGVLARTVLRIRRRRSARRNQRRYRGSAPGWGRERTTAADAIDTRT
ncbi:MAG: glycosyltransferase family 2 protein [Pseudomonadota bacterium]